MTSTLATTEGTRPGTNGASKCESESLLSAQSMTDEVALALADTLKALADPLRLRLLASIAASPEGERCVCDLTAIADVSQPTISHHLKKLKDAGLLLSERRGTWVHYRLAPERRAAVATLLEMFR